MATRVTSPEFVGREAELAQLEDALAGAIEGSPGVVLVGGESGVGKTRLVAAVVGRATQRGARVLSGDCVDLGEAELAYAPIVGALRDIDTGEIEAMLGPAARGLEPLLPQLDDGGGLPANGPLMQGRVFELVLALLGALARNQPLILVVEDLHWADRSTRELLAFLTRNARAERVLVIATFRTDELHRRHPLRPFLAEAERAPIVSRLSLARFTRSELEAQLAGILERQPDGHLVDELFERAEGNPFFTEELVATGADRLPENVRDALMLRIEALSPDAQTVLRVAAAAGTKVRHALLERAADMGSDALVAGLREAVAHHVLVAAEDGDSYAFRHALLREALLDDLLPGERGPLHRALAEALTEDPTLSASARGVAAELAFHWAAAHDLPAAFAASAQAGEEAERLAAFAEANRHFERAAELYDAVDEVRRAGGPSRLELLRRAAEAAQMAGDHERAVALGRQVLALVDAPSAPLTAAVAGERLATYLWTLGLSADALSAIAAAVALLPGEGHEVERARVLGTEGRLLMLLGRGAEAQTRCEEALALARAAGARREETSILTSLGPAVAMCGDADRGIAYLREARRMAEELGALEEMVRTYVNLGEALDIGGQVAEAADVAAQGAAVAAREGIGTGAGLLVSEHAGRLIRLDRWDEAEAVLDQVMAKPLIGVSGAAVLVARAQLDALRGDSTSAEERLVAAELLQRQAVGVMWTTPVAVARATAAIWDARPEDAEAAVAREREGESDEIDLYAAPLIACGARAAADLAVAARATGAGDLEADAVARAAALAADANALATTDSREVELHCATCAAEAERAAGTASPEAWQALADGWVGFGMRYPAAYAWWREAEALLAAGASRGRAQEALRRAHGIAAELGARPLVAEIEGLARRARLALEDARSPSSEPAPGGESAAEHVGLTPRELDVLRLVASGATNREIGQALFISQKTVSVHVSRILDKLGTRTRVEAAGLAQRLGLLDEDEPLGVADVS
jgi:DNA-binding CsgD family transcriptional regulator